MENRQNHADQVPDRARRSTQLDPPVARERGAPPCRRQHHARWSRSADAQARCRQSGRMGHRVTFTTPRTGPPRANVRRHRSMTPDDPQAPRQCCPWRAGCYRGRRPSGEHRAICRRTTRRGPIGDQRRVVLRLVVWTGSPCVLHRSAVAPAAGDGWAPVGGPPATTTQGCDHQHQVRAQPRHHASWTSAGLNADHLGSELDGLCQETMMSVRR